MGEEYDCGVYDDYGADVFSLLQVSYTSRS